MFRRRAPVTQATFEAVRPPPMPDIREALINVRSLEEAVGMAKRAWNRDQLEAALMLIAFWLERARQDLERTNKAVAMARDAPNAQASPGAGHGDPV